MNSGGPISYVLAQRAQGVLRDASLYAPSRTGALRASLKASRVTRESESVLSVRVGSDLDYALWVEEGTGIYGPSRAPIEARGKAMVFEGSYGLVFASRVAGQRPRHFLAKALRAFRFIGGTDEFIHAQDIVDFGLNPNMAHGHILFD